MSGKPPAQVRRKRGLDTTDGTISKQNTKKMRREYPPTLPFVVYQGDKFHVNPEAVEFLNSLNNTKLAVVALAGKYRTGKSFLLDRVMLQRPPGEKGGFAVGHTVQACTRGLHISTNLLSASNSTDGDFKILVVDTEGLGGADETHDSRIFAMALLLASTFMYNSVGTIDQPAIDQLSMVANLSELIRTKGDAGGEEDEDIGGYMPSFIWVLRDAHLRMLDLDGAPIKPDQYLEQHLQPCKGASEAKNKVRASLSKYFRHRTCVPLPRPVNDDAMMEQLDKLPDDAQTPQFREQAQHLRDRVLAESRPKRACGSASVTGPMLARLASIYSQAINQGAAPAIKDAWTLISSDECRNAYDAALYAFETALQSQSKRTTEQAGAMAVENMMLDELKAAIVPAGQLEAAIAKAFDAAAARFKLSAVGSLVEEFQGRLRTELGTRAEAQRNLNRRLASAVSKQMLHGLGSAMQDQDDMQGCVKLFWEHQSRFQDLVQNESTCMAAWNAQSVSAIWQWAVQKTQSMQTKAAEDKARMEVLERQESSWQQAMADVKTQADACKLQLADATQELERLRDVYSESASTTDRLRQEVEEHNNEMSELAIQHNEQTAQLRQELEEAVAARASLAAAKIDLEEQLMQATQRADASEHQVAQHATENQRLQAENTKLLKFEQSFAEATRELQAARRKNLELTAQLDQAADEATEMVSQLRQETQEVVSRLGQKQRQAQTDVATKTEELSVLQREHKQIQSAYAIQVDKLSQQHKSASQELDQLRKTCSEERQHAQEETACLRKEHSQAMKELQRQMDEAAATYRAEQRKQTQKTRDEQDKLLRESYTVTSRAQAAEQRAQHAEEALKDVRRTLAEEREKERQLNHPARISDLESKNATLTAQMQYQKQSLDTKSEVVAELQAHNSDLENQLRNIRKLHEAQVHKLELALAAAQNNF